MSLISYQVSCSSTMVGINVGDLPLLSIREPHA